ncbi:MAG TPA: F0F1 ATP synthase subunit delta, partial [Candidatus Binatia bacterium]|nr:F0F1 ATP synthase subunit delta [Candidatus Binatia bacterium]
MREPTIARNYAETLLELAQRAGDLRGWGEMIESVANAMDTDRRLRMFLESPRLSAGQKNDIIQKAYGATLPRNFVRFL